MSDLSAMGRSELLTEIEQLRATLVAANDFIEMQRNRIARLETDNAVMHDFCRDLECALQRYQLQTK